MTNAAVEAIQYATDLATDEGLVFLRCWNEGDFDACRKEWPDAPPECYIGADPMLAETMELEKKEQLEKEQSVKWEKLMEIGDFVPAVDFKHKFWRGVIDISAISHDSFEEAMSAVIEHENQKRKVA